MARLGIRASSARSVRLADAELVCFAGCNYLGLAQHAEVLAAAREALARYGLGAGASLETSGCADVHEELEQALARFVGAEAALLCPSGYQANVAAAQALAEYPMLFLHDERAHPSLADALAAAVRAGANRTDAPRRRPEWFQVQSYRHLDAEHVVALVGELEPRELVILTDGVFPSERRLAPLPALARALRAERSALWIDDCHALGVLGARGRGSAEEAGLADARLLVTGTLAKALGAHGGFLAGARALVEAAREHAAAYRCSTPIPPSTAAAALAALRVLEREPARLQRLRAAERRIRAVLEELGLALGPLAFPVFAFALDPAEDAAVLEQALRRDGVLVPFVRYPDGPSQGYFRLTVTAEHGEADLAGLEAALRRHALGRTLRAIA